MPCFEHFKMICSLCSELRTLAFPFAPGLTAFCPFPSPSPVFPSPWDKERKNMKELSVGAVEEMGRESISESISGSFWKFQSSHRGNKTFHSHVPCTPSLSTSKHPTSRLAPHCFVGSSPWRSVSGRWVAKASLCRKNWRQATGGFPVLAGCTNASGATEDV